MRCSKAFQSGDDLGCVLAVPTRSVFSTCCACAPRGEAAAAATPISSMNTRRCTCHLKDHALCSGSSLALYDRAAGEKLSTIGLRCQSGPKSAPGQKRRFDSPPVTSGLHPGPDMVRPTQHVSEVPIVL